MKEGGGAAVALRAPRIQALVQLTSLPLIEALAVTLFALGVSIVVFGFFLTIVGTDPVGVYAAIYKGAFGSWFSWQNTLARAAPLILAALCVAIPARLGLIIIGGEGAILLGGLLAGICGAYVGGMPAVLGTFAVLAAGTLTGAAWIGICGGLRRYRGVNETISSLLLVYLAVTIFDHLVDGPLRDLNNVNFPSTRPIDDAYAIGNIPGTDVHWGLAAGIIVCVLAFIFIRFTPMGFAVRIAGGNPRVALLMGLPVGRMVIAVCLVGGAAAGLAGAFEVAAVHGRASGALHVNYGYMGILVAFLARHDPIAIIPAAILTGGIDASSGLIQRLYDLPDATATILQGFVFLSILTSETIYGRASGWLQRRPDWREQPEHR